MSSKEQILGRIRRQKLPEAPLPELRENWIRYADRAAQFAEVLTAVGGTARSVRGMAELSDALRGLECMPSAQKIVCTLADVPLGNTDAAAAATPHALADVDVAIVPGEFAVAENGAVWVADRAVAQRAVLFLTQHLVLVVRRAELLDQMHEAYERLRFESAGYGVFISGPSKTADIEQSLVIGAHGPRSLTVFLVD